MRNERRLARRAARGDRDAFEAIFRCYQQDLYRYCVAILGDSHDAQDALQNTMVKALSALPGERRQIELKPWLYRIAHNESIELRRRQRPLEPLEDETLGAGAGPEQSAAARQRLRELLADIGELPVRQRGALVMRELAGLDFEQIGAALETSPAAARQVLYEARRGLQQMSEGRDMRCDTMTALLSEGDGRVRRRRDVTAHLRECAECREFAAGIRSRTETLAGIAPLPALAAAAMLKGAVSGATVGSGAAGAGATAGSGSAAGMAGGGSAVGTAGAVAGAGAKAVSTATLLKAAAGVVAIVAAGALAVDHGHLVLGGSGSQPASGHTSAATRSVEPARRSGTHGADGVQGTNVRAGIAGTAQARRVGPRHAVDRETALIKSSSTGDAARRTATSGAADAGHANAASHRAAAATEKTHPAHPAHPTHPSHPAHPAHPAKGGHSAAAAHPKQTADSGSGTADTQSSTATRTANAGHASHSATATSESTTESTTTEEADATSAEEEATLPPGQARKQATDEAAAEP